MDKPICQARWHGQKCAACGHVDKLNFHVPDHIWAATTPEEYRNRVICLGCFDTWARRRKVTYAPFLQSVCFAGDQGVFFFSIERALDRSQFAPA